MSTKNLCWILALLLTSAGCRSKPIMTVMRGDMSMNGNMQMAGEMKMSGDVQTSMRTDNTASRLASVPVYANAENCQKSRICVVDVDGLLINKSMSGFGSMGENPVALFREKLDCIATDNSVRAVVLRINSSGGGVTASDMMARDLEQLVTQRQIPVVACLMDVGAGGAYYLAAGADEVVAHPTTLVGGVGVILNLFNLEDMMGQFGVSPLPIKGGDSIDLGSSLRAMEEPERRVLQDIADQFHHRFIDRVQSRRKLDASSDNWSDGRVLTGIQAKSIGLVDHIGYLDDAVVRARQLAGLPESAPVVMLRRDNDRAYTMLDMTPNSPTMSSVIPLKVPGLDRSLLPTYLYLWQPEPLPQ